MSKIWNNVDFTKQNQAGVKKAIKALQDEINTGTGTTNKVLADVKGETIQAVLSIDFVRGILTVLTECGLNNFSQIKAILIALQIADIQDNDKAAFRKAGEYANYAFEKSTYIDDFSALKDTWCNIHPKETTEGLAITFPKANQISNGERDIICFVAQLKKAKLKLKKNKAIILVIDEIFDYLDDANLVACQYYLTQMIAELKSEGRQIFPLIMTHLNPEFFRNFTFSNQKICYLNKIPVKNKSVENIISKRDESTIRDMISARFLHFHPEDVDLSNEFQALGLPADLAKASQFSKHCASQMQQYIEGKQFDPLAVCSGVRRKVEQLIFDSLAEEFREKFLLEHTTLKKLKFAETVGTAVPEVYYLLGVIYNDAMHVNPNQDNFSSSGTKLANLTIKHMISIINAA